ncbi:hypothetical protein [Spiroplasma sp. TIUS-1]|uniref:hypothetical protein n=1 Tax=Spiroplasma sp. TIUS-1 TaxID=216963 RepID=UPI0013A6FDD7|nr:hypothetical protein [Spiroplasma sp. TIUS-1]
MFVIIANIVGIGFIFIFNLYSFIKMYLEDETNGIHGLEKRMGVSNLQIYIMRLFSNKTFIFFWIVISFVLFLMINSIFSEQYSSYILENLTIGLFTQVIFDFMITALISLTLLVKSVKLTSILVSSISILFMLFPITGSVQFIMTPPSASEIWTNNPPEVYKKLTKNENYFISKLVKEYKSNEVMFIVNENDGSLKSNIYTRDIYKGGLILNYPDVFEKINNEGKYQYELHFENYENSLTYKFFNSFQEKIGVENYGSIDSNFLIGQRKSDWSGKGQLKDVIDILKNNKNNFKDIISPDEVENLAEAISYTYNFYPSVYSKFGATNLMSGVFRNIDSESINQYRTGSAGIQLFAAVLNILMSEVFHENEYSYNDMLEINNLYNESQKNQLKIQYFSNPFTHLLLTSILSNYKADYYTNRFNTTLSPLPISNNTIGAKPIFEKIENEKEIKYKIVNLEFQKNKINVGLIYLWWILISSLVFTFSAYIFLKKMNI